MKKLYIAAILILSTIITSAQTNVTLWNIQYSTVDSCGAVPNSAYANQYVNTGGIITAKCSYGYWMQTSHATKWAAIFVYDKKYAPVVGDSITITAQVTEYNNETELDSVKALTVVSGGNQALTPPTLVAFDSIQRREYQAMLVKIKNTTCLRYNSLSVWYVFYDSTMTNGVPAVDTIDNVVFSTQKYTVGQTYDITGVIHFETANWVEPRNANDIVGIANYQANISKVSLFPNPNHGMFTISVNTIDARKNTVMNIEDVTGRIVYTRTLDLVSGQNNIPVNVSGFAKGTYLVQFNNSDGSAFNKFIVE